MACFLPLVDASRADSRLRFPVGDLYRFDRRGRRRALEMLRIVCGTCTVADERDIWNTTQRCTADIERIVRRHPSCWVMNYNFFSNVLGEKDLAALQARESGSRN